MKIELQKLIIVNDCSNNILNLYQFSDTIEALFRCSTTKGTNAIKNKFGDLNFAHKKAYKISGRNETCKLSKNEIRRLFDAKYDLHWQAINSLLLNLRKYYVIGNFVQQLFIEFSILYIEKKKICVILTSVTIKSPLGRRFQYNNSPILILITWKITCVFYSCKLLQILIASIQYTWLVASI